ncbi:similar to An08g11690 [Aspergillus luchuensis]|uniref:Similar to An08g11690 n=1 Tax=Aspergillus kawachii TaxID=1069201 RepID=A0A146FKM2_ASPKA|nr:similar to An08g11690 [Aspergillus luchuensis]
MAETDTGRLQLLVHGKFPKVRELAWWSPWAGSRPKYSLSMREATREKLTSDFSARQQCPGQPGQSQLSRRLETTRCQDGPVDPCVHNDRGERRFLSRCMA